MPYEKPVIALTGQKTMSSAESYALMMGQCPQVTTLGDRTAGSSGCPRLLELPADITVRLPRWLDMDPKGKPLDFVGVKPEVVVETSVNDFKSNCDPVLQAALKRLLQAK
jgi:C-terminal processing protease CtpA/Prc